MTACTENYKTQTSGTKAERKVPLFYLVLLIDQLLLESTFPEDPIAPAFHKHVKLV